MFERLKYLYDTVKLDLTKLQAAVNRGWITQDQYNEIVGV